MLPHVLQVAIQQVKKRKMIKKWIDFACDTSLEFLFKHDWFTKAIQVFVAQKEGPDARKGCSHLFCSTHSISLYLPWSCNHFTAHLSRWDLVGLKGLPSVEQLT